jgi:FAD dependent oxidoreductase TIGR03364
MAGADLVVVGAGIVGLAHAWSAARAGRRVTILDRSARPLGASVRNFGMFWPIGQPPGDRLRWALRSRALWLELAERAGFWVSACGSLHLAHRADELTVLSEFAASGGAGYEVRLLDAGEVRERFPAVRTDGLLGAMFSATEMAIDPREAVVSILRCLGGRPGVELRLGEAVVRVGRGFAETAGGERIGAGAVIVCPGDDLRSLYPGLFREAGVRRCKLQMMRTAPQPAGWRLGAHIAGGLSLRHYATFEHCPSMPGLRARIAAERPEMDRWGIHVMAAQNALGELVIGDSHEYAPDFEPGLHAEIEGLILSEIARYLDLPRPGITERWAGFYAKHDGGSGVLIAEPEPGVRVVAGVGGAGMTISFGLAEEVCVSMGLC